MNRSRSSVNRKRKKRGRSKVISLLLVFIMFFSGIGAAFYVFFTTDSETNTYSTDQGLDGAPSLRSSITDFRKFDTLEDASKMAGQEVALLQYIDIQEIASSELGQFLYESTILGNNELYQRTIVRMGSAVYTDKDYVEFHDVEGLTVFFGANQFYDYKGFTVGVKQNLGIVEETSPLILGPLPTIDYTLDVINGEQPSAFDVYNEKGLFSKIDPEDNWARLFGQGINNYTDSAYIGIKYLEEDNYRLSLVMHLSGSYPTEKLNEMKDGAADRGLRNYSIIQEEDFLIISYEGGWESLINEPLPSEE